MRRTLDVYLHRHLIGKLVQDDHGQMVFSYVESWLNDPAAIPLSQSLPLSKKRFDRNGCRGFFAGILPDENQREIIARNLGISARNDFAMLERIGGECAGAVTFIPEGMRLSEPDHAYRQLTPAELADIIRQLPKRPLLAGEEGVRLSLAGAQDKIALHIADDQISIPLNGAPSTHILKPAIERFKGLVFNEALCMRLAEAVGLNVAKVEIGKVEGIDYLLVQRYDRAFDAVSPGSPAKMKRLHQEDFCQALGEAPERKYQNEGGPSIQQCFELLRAVSSTPVIDLQALLDAVIFNWLIGNQDAHAKNFSLLYRGEIWSSLQTRLAPLYDLICTVYYPELSPKLAMKIGGDYVSERVGPANFERMAEEAGLAKPITKQRVKKVAESVISKLPAVSSEHPVALGVAKAIRSRSELCLKRFAR
ncbi:MAG TPA: type II toxin-antitoxin system HipA family toxin [Candidatus Paceibacterota bacterium]|nr:type II toxin-antitoxin system HipA family toxin [Verrucomicrobiota bacterium]HRY46531.1 type II toxin-antitoxin system HipA family toxin [Candidatus Paceibacterota bacterium]HRZ99262.1 type II toxin-antitoxin system HipA family toxin [Candidatus Paceibacterota bacterium]